MNDAQPSGRDDLGEITDPGEYNQRRRLRAVHDSMDRFHQQRRQARDLLSRGQISQNTYLSMLREAVESVLYELEPQLREFDPTDADDEKEAPGYYWTSVELGSVEIPPDGKPHQFQGLRSIVEFPDPMTVTWEEEPDPPAGFSSVVDPDAGKREETVQVPREVLIRAARAVRAFMNDVGLDLGFDRTSHDDGDHSDLKALLRARGQTDAAAELPEVADD